MFLPKENRSTETTKGNTAYKQQEAISAASLNLAYLGNANQ